VTRDVLRRYVAAGIAAIWAITLFMPGVPRTGVQAAMILVLTWLFVIRPGNGHGEQEKRGSE
jgi:hypothetical protein